MLSVKSLEKQLGEFRLSDVSFDVANGEYFVLLGRSGSGKTQLLEVLSGVAYPDSGAIVMDGKDITWLRPQHRNIGMVFQDFAVFPHMTTYDNIAYPLRVRKIPEREIVVRVSEIAEKMSILPILYRRTLNLSGGELQRTALARTLVVSPRLLLLDEPLASIDASLKDDISRLLRSLNKSGQTIIHVTHDYSEAIGSASKVGVIHNGEVIQTGSPGEVFDHPGNRFVARYTGIRNFFRVKYFRESDGWRCITSCGIVLNLNDSDYPSDGLLVIRNKNVRISRSGDTGKNNTFRGRIVEMVPTPTGFDLELLAEERIFASVSAGDTVLEGLQEGSEVIIRLDPDDLVSLRGNEVTVSD